MKKVTDSDIVKMVVIFSRKIKRKGCTPTEEMLYCYAAGLGAMRYKLTGKTHVKSK